MSTFRVEIQLPNFLGDSDPGALDLETDNRNGGKGFFSRCTLFHESELRYAMKRTQYNIASWSQF